MMNFRCLEVLSIPAEPVGGANGFPLRGKP